MDSPIQTVRAGIIVSSFVICLVAVAIVSGCSTNPFKGNLFKSNLLSSNESKMASAEWLESYDEAMQLAEASGRPILVDFTGTDWCVWCERLDEEVFEKSKFKTFAEENVVLLRLDYPRSGNQSETLKLQNERLAKKYNIESYPTVLFLTSDGTELGRTGYVKGGPKSFIKTAARILQGDSTLP